MKVKVKYTESFIGYSELTSEVEVETNSIDNIKEEILNGDYKVLDCVNNIENTTEDHLNAYSYRLCLERILNETYDEVVIDLIENVFKNKRTLKDDIIIVG